MSQALFKSQSAPLTTNGLIPGIDGVSFISTFTINPPHRVTRTLDAAAIGDLS
jgi:hypothetical protein